MITYLLITILLIIIVTCIGYLSSTREDNLFEKFETYQYGPFDYVTTGSSPLSFYEYPVYRKPSDYPYKIFSSYPYPHLTYKDNIL